eukprot:CFRG7989T1
MYNGERSGQDTHVSSQTHTLVKRSILDTDVGVRLSTGVNSGSFCESFNAVSGVSRRAKLSLRRNESVCKSTSTSTVKPLIESRGSTPASVPVLAKKDNAGCAYEGCERRHMSKKLKTGTPLIITTKGPGRVGVPAVEDALVSENMTSGRTGTSLSERGPNTVGAEEGEGEGVTCEIEKESDLVVHADSFGHDRKDLQLGEIQTKVKKQMGKCEIASYMWMQKNLLALA